jgi:hypothetical protein
MAITEILLEQFHCLGASGVYAPGQATFFGTNTLINNKNVETTILQGIHQMA